MARTSKKSPTTFGNWALVILDAAERRGLDADAIATAAGLDRAALHDPDHRVPQPIMTALWREIVAASGDAAIGIQLPVALPFASFQALGYAIAASSTLENALKRAVRYQKFVSDAVEAELHETGDTITYAARPLYDGDDVPPPVAMEAFMSLKLRIFRNLMRDDTFCPVSVKLMRPTPKDTSAFDEFFQAPIAFGHRALELSYRTEDLRHPLPAANEELARGNDRILAEQLERLDGAPVLDRVLLAIEAELAHGPPSKQAVARRLGMSARTLQRRLAEAESSFREVTEEVRFSLAKRHLREGTLSIGEIAFALGYGQVSAFTRAFRRWTGSAPSDFDPSAS